MEDIWGYIIGLILFIASFFYGKKEGREDEKQDNQDSIDDTTGFARKWMSKHKGNR